MLSSWRASAIFHELIKVRPIGLQSAQRIRQTRLAMRNDDYTDPFDAPRDPMSRWEQSLRPATSSGWLVAGSVIFVLCGVAYLGAGILNSPGAPRASKEASPITASEPLPPPRLPNARIPEASKRTVELTKCLGAQGAVAYSDGPCPAGTRASTLVVRPDANLADGMSEAERTASIQSNRIVAQQLAQYEMRVAASGEQSSGECAQLEAVIAELDRAARMPQTGFEQDRLSALRRQARDRQFRLRCA